MREALTAAKEGTQGVWVILERGSGAPIGSTRYMALRPEHDGLEIGWTWIGKCWWRTGANVETKLLLFGHAFDTLGCERGPDVRAALRRRLTRHGLTVYAQQ
jgi:RimJ/RimL family protein N-acetyltransferase